MRNRIVRHEWTDQQLQWIARMLRLLAERIENREVGLQSLTINRGKPDLFFPLVAAHTGKVAFTISYWDPAPAQDGKEAHHEHHYREYSSGCTEKH